MKNVYLISKHQYKEQLFKSLIMTYTVGQLKHFKSNSNKSWLEPGNAPRIGIGHIEVVCQK